MFRYIRRKAGFFFSRIKSENSHAVKEGKVSSSLAENIMAMEDAFADCGDFVVREFAIPGENQTGGAVMFIDGLVKAELINDSVMKPIMSYFSGAHGHEKGVGTGAEEVARSVLYASDAALFEEIRELINGCLTGDAAVFLDGSAKGIRVNSKGWEKRGVTEAVSESVVRGPREGFTENLRSNTALIRRKIKNADLKMKSITVGQKTRTDICIAYIQGIADPEVIRKVEYRIKNLEIDSVLDSGYIEEYIEDAPFSIFATVSYSEKPDVVAARMLEGRVGIIVDGSPFVLCVPALFIESFQTAEDYYIRPLFASIIRLMRYAAFFLSVFAPAVYIALTTFHQEFIPTKLLLTVAGAREGTPFPAFLEAVVMVFSFELLREAGIRLPRPVGQAISIVGALIMGDAAVSAGLVGAPMVITVAITAVAGFAVPEQYDAVAILRFISMIFAATLGGFGIAFCFLAVLIHLSTLKSFGVPFFEGFTLSRDLQDTYIRAPLWSMVKRPKDIAKGDVVRRRFFIPPLRPHKEEE